MPSSASSTSVLYTLSLHDALPIFSSIAILLSFRTIKTFSPDAPRLFKPSKAIPPVKEPSPIIATVFIFSPCKFAAFAIPNAAEMLRSEDHTSELQSRPHLVCRLLLHPLPFSTLFPYTTLFRSFRQLQFYYRLGQLKHFRQTHLGYLSLQKQFLQLKNHRQLLQQCLFFRLVNLLLLQFLTQPKCLDRKITRLNSSHVRISYAVFCFIHFRSLHSFPTRRSSDLFVNCNFIIV